MEASFFVIADREWLTQAPPNSKRLTRQNLYPLGASVGHLSPGCRVLVKFRAANGVALTDDTAEIVELKGSLYLRSSHLATYVLAGASASHIAAFFEGTPQEARCIVQPIDAVLFDILALEDPALRLDVFDLPPRETVLVTSRPIVAALYQALSAEDPELYAVHVSRFLDSPHILTPLFSHVLRLRSDQNVNFIITIKKLAEQLRVLLSQDAQSVRIHRIHKSHVDAWSEVQGKQVAFLDGGVARIPGAARLEPLAMRVGVYAVIPGRRVIDGREKWIMRPYVIGDCIDPRHPMTEHTDPRRLLEASRYTFEPLTALAFLKAEPSTSFLLMHGPLVNQFAMYDEGEPHYIPALDPTFLQRFGITEAVVTATVQDLPEDAKYGGPFWNHFMSVYTHLMLEVQRHPIPIAGVVERLGGRSVSRATLAALRADRVVTDQYVRKVESILDQYDISDDFLFGCILREGEYITPVSVDKNLERRARERWNPVVRQLPAPAATMIKTDDSVFPFRIEMNLAAAGNAAMLVRLIYHTARLLPRYAFPVGLDIADKYAKVPDWIAKGISAELSAALIRRAVRTGDAHVVAQVRQLLAQSPRDFFFRPAV